MEVGGRVVVVTGAARGIGRAMARRFASAGAAAVVVADIDASGAAAVAAEFGGSAVECNVAIETEVEALVEKVESDHGQIDIFCSNAGIAIAGGAEWPRPIGSGSGRST